MGSGLPGPGGRSDPDRVTPSQARTRPDRGPYRFGPELRGQARPGPGDSTRMLQRPGEALNHVPYQNVAGRTLHAKASPVWVRGRHRVRLGGDAGKARTRILKLHVLSHSRLGTNQNIYKFLPSCEF